MSFLDDIQAFGNGIVTAAQPYINWLTDNRNPDTSRPRINSADPASKIDTTDTTARVNFPHDLPKYYITFGFQDYSRPSQFVGMQANTVTDYLCLPVPNNLRDNNTLGWDPNGRGNIAIDTLAYNFNKSANHSDLTKPGGVDSMLSDLAKSAGAATTGVVAKQVTDSLKKISDAVLPSSLKGSGDGLLQIAGLADNPFMTVAFTGPEFKTHSFFWRLAAKSREESDTIKKICDTFKKCAYPELLAAETGGFYRYPKIVRPRFMPSAAENYMYAFKPCVITNIDINFSPNDRPGFFADSSAPVEVVLTLQLTEIELWRNGGGINPDETNTNFGNVPAPPGTTFRDVGTI